MNAHDFSRLRTYHGAGYQFQAPGLPGPVDEEGNAANFQEMITEFPDLTWEVTQKIAGGDYVVMNWTATGTNDGPLTMPSGDTVPPTGRNGSVIGSSTMEFKNGKIVRQTILYDSMTVMAQLGLMPGM